MPGKLAGILQMLILESGNNGSSSHFWKYTFWSGFKDMNASAPVLIEERCVFDRVENIRPQWWQLAVFVSDKSVQWQWLAKYPPVLYRFQARVSVPSVRAGLHTNPLRPAHALPPSVTHLFPFRLGDGQLVSRTKPNQTTPSALPKLCFYI